MILQMTIGAIAGFSLGCIVSIVVAMILFNNFQKKQERKAENRHNAVNGIGRLCADIENAFSSYRMGKLTNEKLRDSLKAKIDTITTEINSNIDILDSYYVKHIERFVQDQNSFLAGDEGKIVQSEPAGERSVSRGSSLNFEQHPAFDFSNDTKTVLQEYEPDVSFDMFEKEESTLVPEPVKVEKKPGARSFDPVSFEKEKPYVSPKSFFDEPFDLQPASLETLTFGPNDFEAKITAFEMASSLKKEPEEVEEVKEAEAEEVEEVEVEKDEDFFNIEKPSKKEKVPPPPPMAFTKMSEPIKGSPVFEAAFDASSTQEFDLRDIERKPFPREKMPQPSPTQIIRSVHSSESLPVLSEEEDVFEVDIPAMKSSAKTVSLDEESLITGNEVMDKIDSIFGCEEKKKGN